jgi:arylsulfatase A-like enzyme
MRKKNIMLITSDQQRWDAVSWNNSLVKTPNLDRLKDKGIVYDRGYTCNPVCTPARTSILTGHYPSKHNCYTIGTSLPENYPTVPEIMSNNGYFTSLIGKAHFNACLTEGSFESEPHIFNRDYFRNWNGPFYGFDHVHLVIGHANEKHAGGMHYGVWLEDQGIDTNSYFGTHAYTDFGTWDLPEHLHNSKWTADKTIEAMDMAKDQEKPFYIWASFQDPHNPCFVPEPWASMYDPEEVPVYGLKDGEMQGKPPFYQDVVEGRIYGDSEPDLQYMGHCVAYLPFIDEAQKKEIMTKYYGMVSLMDHHIGRILDHLEENDLMDDTIIVFTSDHGDYMGNHGMWWKGLPAYEDAQKVPFLVYHPDNHTPGERSEALQSLVDLGQTFLSAAGIPLPPGLQGVNQENAWKHSASHERSWAMVEFRPTEGPFMQKTFITNSYKLVMYNNKSYGELYDLQQDPDQYRNLWEDPTYQSLKVDLFQQFISAEMQKDGTLRTRTSNA